MSDVTQFFASASEKRNDSFHRFGMEAFFIKRKFSFNMVSSTILIFFLLPFFLCTNAIHIPIIKNTSLVALSSEYAITLRNSTCNECLCQTIGNYAVLNCFSNNTCQFFLTIPRRYRLQSMSEAHLIFPNGQIPNKNQCCMSNLTEVIEKLRNGSRTATSINTSRCLIMNKDGLLVTPERYTGYLNEYNATTLNLTRRMNITVSTPLSLATQDGKYYVGLSNDKILVVDSTNLSVLTTISSSQLNSIRDILFLNNGDIMVVAATSDGALVFFKRMNNSSTNYTFLFKQFYTSVTPHGLLYVNDTFFYATSWSNRGIYSFTPVNSTYWQETLFVNASSFPNTSGGAHITLDECGRYWFALGPAGFIIFDHQGLYLASYIPFSVTNTFHAVISENYVLYVSDIGSNQILRIDPNILC